MLAIGAMLAALILLAGRPGARDDDDDKPAASAKAAAPASKKPAAAPAAPDRIPLDEAQMRGAGITIATVQAGTVRRVVTLPAEIRTNEDRTAIVLPKVAGSVDAAPAVLGQHVKRGQTLAVIASSAVSDLRSELQAAEQRTALAKTTYEREKMLWQDKISAEQDYLQARQAWQEAQIAAANLRQKLAALDAAPSHPGGLNRYDVRAPFDGIVTEKHLTLGTTVKEDTPIFQVADLSTVWADITVPANQLGTVRVGESVTIRSGESNLSATGKISYVSAVVGDQNRSARARVILLNPKLQWRPGFVAEAEVAADEVSVPVVVAADAVREIEGKPSVFVRVKDGFIVQPVTVGRSDGRTTEIVAGLKPGTSYAADGSFVLKAEHGKSAAQDND